MFCYSIRIGRIGHRLVHQHFVSHIWCETSSKATLLCGFIIVVLRQRDALFLLLLLPQVGAGYTYNSLQCRVGGVELIVWLFCLAPRAVHKLGL